MPFTIRTSGSVPALVREGSSSTLSSNTGSIKSSISRCCSRIKKLPKLHRNKSTSEVPRIVVDEPVPASCDVLSEEEIDQRLEWLNTVMCGPLPPYTPISAGASTESLAETLFFTPLIPETEKFAEEDAADSLQQREATVIPTIVITAAEQEASPPSPELPRGRSRSRHDPRMYLSPTSSWPSPSTVCRGSPGAVTWQAAPQRPSHSRSGRASKRIGSRRNNMPSWLSPFRCWLADLNLPGRVLYLAACLLAYVGIPLLWAYFTFTSLPKTLHAKVYRWRLSRDD